MIFEIQLWQRLILYAFILIALFIYVKLTQLEVNGIKLIKLRYRILISSFFPLIFIILFSIGSIILALALTVIFILFLLSLFKKPPKMIKIRI